MTIVICSVRFHDYEDMLEDTWHIDFPRRPDMSDAFYPNANVGLPMWESYPVFSAKPKKEEKVGLAEAITNSILLAGSYRSPIYLLYLYKLRFRFLLHCLVLHSQDA